MKNHFHPLSVLLYFGTVFYLSMTWSNPLWITFLCITALSLLSICPGTARIKKVFLFSLPVALTFAAANALLSGAGETSIRLFHCFSISIEALIFGLCSGTKIITVFVIFALGGELVDRDELFLRCSRFAPKSSLATGLALLMVPRFKNDLARLSDIMRLRGVEVGDRNILKRIPAYRPFMQTLLLSSLEGAWDTAIALHCRAAGSAGRTPPLKRRFSTQDMILIGGSLLILIPAIWIYFSHRDVYLFYPHCDNPLQLAGIAYSGLTCILVVAAFCFAGRNNEHL